MLLLFVYWECCCYLCIGNVVVVCVLGMLLSFVYWQCCCYLYIGNAAVISALVMMLFVYL